MRSRAAAVLGVVVVLAILLTTSATGQIVTPSDPVIQNGPDDPTNSQNATFTFTGDEGVTFRCKLDTEGSFSDCSSPQDYTGLPEGDRVFQVKAVDLLSNESGVTSYSWTIDLTDPTTSITDKPADPSADASPSFSFTSSEGSSSFKCKLDDGSFLDCDSPKTYTSLADGSHTFTVKATDPAGNTDASPPSYTWTIDATAPNTSITAKPTNPSSDASPSFSFTSSEGGSSFECKLDAGAFGSCSSPKAYSSLADGSHTFTVRAVDGVGNVDPTPATYTWTVDLVPPPTPTITSGPSGVVTSGTATFSFQSEAGASYECTLDGTARSCPTFSGLADGLHTLEVLAVDAAGNESLPATRIWTVDLSPPHPSVTSPAENSGTSDRTPQLLGTADTGPADDNTVTVDIYAGPSATGNLLETLTGVNVSAGNWSVLPTNRLAVGTYTVEVSQSDSFLRTGTSSPVTFRIDRTAPRVTLSRPLNGAFLKNKTPTFRGTAGTAEGDGPEVTLEVHSGGTATGPLVGTLIAPVAADGTWSIAQPTPLADGKYAALAKQSDNAAQTGTSGVHVFTIDTIAPSALTTATIRAGYGAVTLGWRRGSNWKTTDVLAIYRRVVGAQTRSLRARSAATSWTDRRVRNGVTYQYDLVPVDRAHNRATPLIKRGRPSGFRTPKNGARLSAPIGISWVDVANADYSNIQVWRVRNSHLVRKILSVWPTDNGYTLRPQWRYRGQAYRLQHGRTYRIYGWPGFGAVSGANYGKSYGWVQFTFR